MLRSPFHSLSEALEVVCHRQMLIHAAFRTLGMHYRVSLINIYTRGKNVAFVGVAMGAAITADSVQFLLGLARNVASGRF